MARIIYLLFGVVAYAVFFATFLYLIAFVGNCPQIPFAVDRGPEGALPVAIAVDLALIALFGVQHSVMARAPFKAAWTRIVPAPVERSMYVLLASLCLILLFVFWRPIPTVIWSVQNQIAAYALWALFGLGWLIVLISTFLINHFELFGLPGLEPRRRPRNPRAEIPHALLLPLRPPSDLFGLRPRFLGDAAHDRRPPSPRHRHDDLHPDRHRP